MRTALTKALVLSLVVAAGLLAAPQAHAQLGFGVGLNFAEFDDIQAGTDQAAAEATYENSTGYHIGLFYDLAVGPLALRPGVYYRQSGKFEVPSDVVGARDEFNLSLIEIPIDLRLRLATIPIVKPYLLGGPVLMFPHSRRVALHRRAAQPPDRQDRQHHGLVRAIRSGRGKRRQRLNRCAEQRVLRCSCPPGAGANAMITIAVPATSW